MILSSRWNERGIEDPWPTITRRNDQYRLVVSSIHGTRCYFIADHRTTKIASRPMMNYGEELGGRRAFKKARSINCAMTLKKTRNIPCSMGRI